MGRQWLWFALPAAATVGLFVAVALFGGGFDEDEPSVRTVAATTTTQEDAVVTTATTIPAPRTQTGATTTRPNATARERPGRGTAQIPDFRGLTEERAVARVDAAGFEPLVRRVRSFQPDGTVIEQTPRPGVRASRGRTVRLVVSVLKPRIPPPQRTVTPPPLSS